MRARLPRGACTFNPWRSPPADSAGPLPQRGQGALQESLSRTCRNGRRRSPERPGVRAATTFCMPVCAAAACPRADELHAKAAFHLPRRVAPRLLHGVRMIRPSFPSLGPLLTLGWFGALLVATLACGGSATLESPGSGGAGATGGSGAGGEAGAGGQPPDCPPEVPQASTPCELAEAIVCTYPIDCQSGQRSLGFLCGGSGLWDMAPGQTCEYGYDSCPDTTYCCDGQWLLPGPEAPRRVRAWRPLRGSHVSPTCPGPAGSCVVIPAVRTRARAGR